MVLTLPTVPLNHGASIPFLLQGTLQTFVLPKEPVLLP